MPRGIPNAPRPDGLGPSENTKRLIQAMQDLQDRIDSERRRDRGRNLLMGFIQKHALQAEDLRQAAKVMSQRKKGAEPVLSVHKPKKLPTPKVAAKGKLGKAIRAGRTKLGMSTNDVGLRIGVSGGSVSAWEVGRRVPPKQHHAALLDLLKLPKGALANGHASAG